LLADGVPATGIGMRSGAADGLCELHTFYEHFDFDPSTTRDDQLFLLMKDLRKLVEPRIAPKG